MLYDTAKISEQCNISRRTAYVKLKLPEVKSLVINKNGRLFVDEEGLGYIKESLKQGHQAETEIAGMEAELLKEDMIDVLKSDNEFLKKQLDVKDEQIEGIKKLLENNQVIFQQEQEKNKTVLNLSEVIKEHDIELVNRLSKALEIQRAKAAEQEEELQKKKGFFKRLFEK
jgi:hypothetical protein